MKYWKNERVENGYGPNGIILKGDVAGDRIVSLSKDMNGDIVIMEECDYYFSITMTKAEIKEALEEAIQWVENI